MAIRAITALPGIFSVDFFNTDISQIHRFEKIVETLSDVHILVVAGKNENGIVESNGTAYN